MFYKLNYCRLSTVSSKPVFTDSDISLTEIEDALNIQKNKDFNILEDFDQSILDFNESKSLFLIYIIYKLQV